MVNWYDQFRYVVTIDKVYFITRICYLNLMGEHAKFDIVVLI